eukprot:TRINITY_DN28764_c0_g1_i1.p2 TRINITY_DN28764_c0_g1~~TRINITY_DN28764_c0_g1_i1.p2  ORF type:complete len:264 (+),score=50.41 TRINITY_DN28764_c0_g1_i1:144-935(+)
MDQDQLDIVGNALCDAFQQIPEHKNVIVVTFGGSVSVYELFGKCPEVVSAVALPGEGDLDQAMLKKVIEARQVCLPLSTCIQNAKRIVQNLMTFQESVTERHRARCLGRAIEISIALAQPQSDLNSNLADQYPQQNSHSRVIVLASGPSTKGPGTVPLSVIDGDISSEDLGIIEDATKFYQKLADDAEIGGISIDVFSGGLAAVNVPLLENLVRTSGGAILLSEGFTPLLAQNLVAAVTRVQGKDGIIDMYFTGGIEIKRYFD